ncbi:MAG: M20/M25/M40 family metallo-hydrolase [Kiritimatiellaeota bacterium]|nr:M20/M25/M40 family metallo-hydrolase [Kiritimatiellota bacterium]
MGAHGDAAAEMCDDKAGVFIIAEAFRILAERRREGRGPKVAVHCVSATQEEVGLLGSIVASYGIAPHAGIAVDVCHATDIPGGDPKKTGAVKIGGGPAVAFGPPFDGDFLEIIRNAAKAASMPIQMVPTPRSGGTDAHAIRHTRAGVPVALIKIPLRYMHSAVELLSLDDLEKCALLIADTVEALPEDFEFGPKL